MWMTIHVYFDDEDAHVIHSEDEKELMAEASSRAKERVQAELKKFRIAAVKGGLATGWP